MLVKRLKSKVKSSKLLLKVFLISSFFLPLLSQAQCAMCRAALESEEGGVQAEAINDGIVYLMVIPYVLVAVAAYAIYKIRSVKKTEKE
ncbi:hypothetical protein [Flavobacterium sp.]|jgi:hypothetical protein|uniref:hypothetical protein n=1 Tax=Flavobacterium sp. TaxID=239 RepID=UPI0039C6E26F